MAAPLHNNQLINKDFIYDQIPCGLISFKPDGSIIAANPTLSKWIGIDVAGLLEHNFKTLLEQPSMLYYNMIIDPLLNLKNEVSEFSLRFIGVDGLFDALFNAACYKDSSGKVSVINASIQKITDRKKFEQELLLEKRKAEEQRQLAEAERRRFEFLFNSVPNKIWTLDAQGTVLHMNNRAETFFTGIDPNQQNAFTAVAKQDRARAIFHWRNCLANGRKFERELRLRCYPDRDREEWFLVCAEPYLDSNDEIELWFCSATNIHRKKLLQIASQQEMKSNLSSAYKDLDEKSGLLAKLAFDQSHMVRKPLANILGLAELVKGEADDATRTALLDMLLNSANELDRMIKDISGRTNSEERT